ncbi:unnamed protein product, partial [Polarella glacialis]
MNPYVGQPFPGGEDVGKACQKRRRMLLPAVGQQGACAGKSGKSAGIKTPPFLPAQRCSGPQLPGPEAPVQAETGAPAVGAPNWTADPSLFSLSLDLPTGLPHLRDRLEFAPPKHAEMLLHSLP